MLSFFRRVMTSWVMLGFLGILLVGLVITGIGDPFGGGGPPPGSLARVGEKNITESDFGRAFDRLMDSARQQNPQLTNADAAREGAVESLVEQLVAGAAIEEFGRAHGIVASDRLIDGEIASIRAFQRAGKFDQTAYEAALTSQRISEKDLRDGLRGEAVRRQMLAPILLGAQAPRGLAEPYTALLLESRAGEIATIPSSFAARDVGQPTEAQLRAFYTANIQRYTIPERRAFRYAVLTQAQAESEAAPTEAEIKADYDARAEEFGGVAQRVLSQVVTQDEAVARTLVRRARGGEDFARLASELAGFAAADLELGVQTQPKLAASTNAAVAAAAFAAAQGAVTDPVQSDFGWHVVRVDRIVPSAVRPLAAVRGEIAAKLRAEKGADLLATRIGEIEDALTEGQSFAEVAAERDLAAVPVPPITRDGRIINPPAGFALDPRAAVLVARAFEKESGEEPSVQEVDKSTFALLDVTEVVPPTPVPLAEIRAEVTAQWRQRQAMLRAKALADAVAADAEKGVPLGQALAERGLPEPQTVAGRRIELMQRGGPVPAPLALMFSLPQGEVRAIAAPGDQGYYVVRVANVTRGNAAADLNLLGGTQAQIARGLPQELAAQFARAVEKEIEIERSPKLIAATRARIAGEANALAQ
jgi:parvulin-like peptidyl-prolyl isomerase